MKKELENAVKKVVEMIKKEESPSDSAEWVIGEIVIEIADNHYEALGILEEALLSHREISLNVLKVGAESGVGN